MSKMAYISILQFENYLKMILHRWLAIGALKKAIRLSQHLALAAAYHKPPSGCWALNSGHINITLPDKTGRHNKASLIICNCQLLPPLPLFPAVQPVTTPSEPRASLLPWQAFMQQILELPPQQFETSAQHKRVTKSGLHKEKERNSLPSGKCKMYLLLIKSI